MRSAITVLLLLSVLTHAAWADGYPGCSFYRSGDKKVPAEAAEILAIVPEQTVEVCGGGSNIRFYEHTKPRRGLIGACYSFASEITKRKPGDGKPGWDFESVTGFSSGRRTYLSAAPGSCPAQPDPSYILASGISEGVFLRLSAFWGEVKSSREAFARASTLVSHEEKEGESYRTVAEALASAEKGALSLDSIRFDSGSDTRAPAYELYIVGPDGGWGIDVDVEGGVVRVVGVSTIVE